MRLHRFIGDFDFENILTGNAFKITDARLRSQIRAVLRFQVGDEFILCDGNNTDAHVRMTACTPDSVSVSIESFSKSVAQIRQGCTLYCAVLKKDSFEWVVQKATEVGVSRIVPVLTKRTIKSALSHARMQHIAREASEQSGRGSVPAVDQPITFDQAIIARSAQNASFFCDQSGADIFLLVKKTKQSAKNIFIGPEGGWDPTELARASEMNMSIASLGTTMLRSETAAIVASYVALNA